MGVHPSFLYPNAAAELSLFLVTAGGVGGGGAHIHFFDPHPQPIVEGHSQGCRGGILEAPTQIRLHRKSCSPLRQHLQDVLVVLGLFQMLMYEMDIPPLHATFMTPVENEHYASLHMQ